MKFLSLNHLLILPTWVYHITNVLQDKQDRVEDDLFILNLEMWFIILCHLSHFFYLLEIVL